MRDASEVTRSTTSSLREALHACPLIAVLRRINPEEIESVGDILIEAGFRLIEVPLNSPEPFKSIERLARRCGNSGVIGAGTVMTPDDVFRVGRAGGRLIVTPHAGITVIRAAKDHGFVCIPGVAAPTEGFAALAAGADGLKIFPADAISPIVVKAWRAVFAKEVPLIPTGGIVPQTVAGWVKAGASGVGTGSHLYAPGRSLKEIRGRAIAFVEAWRAAKQNEDGAGDAAVSTSSL